MNLQVKQERENIRMKVRNILNDTIPSKIQKSDRDRRINDRSIDLISDVGGHGVWAAFCARAFEPDISRVINSSKNLDWVFPVVDSKNRKMTFYQPRTAANFKSGFAKILEPDLAHSREVEKEEINGFLVPCLAVDRVGHRLGTGQGYYDRYLAKSNKIKIGICYDCQVVRDNIPSCDWDVAMDWIVTESQSIECRKD